MSHNNLQQRRRCIGGAQAAQHHHLDIGMPDTDGYEFLKKVKVIPGMDDIPAIAIGYAATKTGACLGVGTALVSKPIDVDVFSLIQQLNLPNQGSAK